MSINACLDGAKLLVKPTICWRFIFIEWYQSSNWVYKEQISVNQYLKCRSITSKQTFIDTVTLVDKVILVILLHCEKKYTQYKISVFEEFLCLHRGSYFVVVVHLHHVPLAVTDASIDVRWNCSFGLTWKTIKEMQQLQTHWKQNETFWCKIIMIQNE